MGIIFAACETNFKIGRVITICVNFPSAVHYYSIDINLSISIINN